VFIARVSLIMLHDYNCTKQPFNL